ncbi:hypothetical protein K0U91_06205 [Chryseobacterium chendengshani]|uniref:hypothetical protein n=2 Tax=Chryseobacterium sp. LJ668 TaxID=2864040 RepID=UPI001C691AA8|nr:hypothetical protein [Chryseobacterium sp. LJ668]MBW8522063.1 hypothetical protein [Chryseobacterium sp. LJ668]QYK17715.1 hypothetical protein K0U91_06205 [Chryseobacterium sp. LJ668]
MIHTPRLSMIFFLAIGTFIFSQEKKKNFSTQNVLARIIPNDKIDFWTLVQNNYGKNEEIKTSGAKKDYAPQSSGFNITPTEDSFYYIVYSEAGKLNYITEIAGLKDFIGKVDNVEEAALAQVLEGYVIDEQFAHVAGNYYEDKANYYLDLGKVTSKECPYEKKHFTVTVNKATSQISEVKENGTYIELYTKKCPNNPRLLKIEKKEEPKDEPKKKPVRKRK